MRLSLNTRALIAAGLLSLFGYANATSAQTVPAPCAADRIPVQVVTRDADGNLVPGVTYHVFRQLTNPDGGRYLSSKALVSGKTDAGGQGPLHCLKNSDAPLAVKFITHGTDLGAMILWDDAFTENRGIDIAEIFFSSLEITLRDGDGNLLPNIPIEVHTQTVNADGVSVEDPASLTRSTRLLSTTTGPKGLSRAYVGPGLYVVKATAPVSGLPIYLWKQAVRGEDVTVVDYGFPTLRIIIQNGLGHRVPGYGLTLTTQLSGRTGLPIAGQKIGQRLKTDADGTAVIYMPPGVYALQVPSSAGQAPKQVWNLDVAEDEILTTVQRLSGLRVKILNDKSLPKPNARFSLFLPTTTKDGKIVPGPVVSRFLKTGSDGIADLYLPPAVYLLAVGQEQQPNVRVYPAQFTQLTWPKNLVLQPSDEFTVDTHLANTTLAAVPVRTPRISVFPRYRQRLSSTFRVTAKALPQPYTVRFSYSEDDLLDLDIAPKKLRILFRSDRTRKWTYVGSVSPSRKTVSAKLKETGMVLLVARR